jgi:hypothetical protein
MVRHGNKNISRETENDRSCNVRYIWYTVDATEIYQVYSAGNFVISDFN